MACVRARTATAEGEDLHTSVQRQIELYFLRENIATDPFLGAACNPAFAGRAKRSLTRALSVCLPLHAHANVASLQNGDGHVGPAGRGARAQAREELDRERLARAGGHPAVVAGSVLTPWTGARGHGLSAVRDSRAMPLHVYR